MRSLNANVAGLRPDGADDCQRASALGVCNCLSARTLGVCGVGLRVGTT